MGNGMNVHLSLSVSPSSDDIEEMAGKAGRLRDLLFEARDVAEEIERGLDVTVEMEIGKDDSCTE